MNKEGSFQNKHTQWVHTLLLLLAALVWGAAFVAQRIGAEYVGPMTFLASRSWLATGMLAVIYKVQSGKKTEEDSQKTHSSRKGYVITAGMICAVFLFSASIVQQIGIPETTAAKAGFITAMYVIIVPILSLFQRRKVGVRIWVCVAIAIVGLYLLTIQEGFTLEKGDLLMLLCAFLFSMQILSVEHFVRRVDPIVLSLMQFLFTAIYATIGMVLTEGIFWEGIQKALLSICYAGFISSGVGYTLQIIGQKDLNPALASLSMSMESVFAALAGWILLGQSLSWKEWLGCILMFATIIGSQISKKEIKNIKNDM